MCGLLRVKMVVGNWKSGSSDCNNVEHLDQSNGMQPSFQPFELWTAKLMIQKDPWFCTNTATANWTISSFVWTTSMAMSDLHLKGTQSWKVTFLPECVLQLCHLAFRYAKISLQLEWPINQELIACPANNLTKVEQATSESFLCAIYQWDST